MADVMIESIAIEITASADKADKALQKLTQSLAALKAAASGGLEGADKVAQSLKQIATAANEFQNINGDKVKNVAEALRALKSIGQVGDLSNAAKQVKKLRQISETVNQMPEIDTDRLKGLTKLKSIINSLSRLGEIGTMPDLSGIAASLQPLMTAANGISGTDMSTFAANMQQLAAGLQPLSGMQNRNFSSIVNALGRLPDIAKNISRMNLGTFARQMQQIATAIQPLSQQMRSLSSSFSRMPEPVQQAITAMMNFNTSVRNTNNNTTQLGKALKLANFTAFYFAAKRVINVLGSFITSSNSYIENLNLFTVTMGEAADEALEFANKVNSVMGIDVSQWVQNQGYFKQLVSGFGMVEEKANLVSKNLTQLGYDISSYFNISIEDSMQKLQSGIAGKQFCSFEEKSSSKQSLKTVKSTLPMAA